MLLGNVAEFMAHRRGELGLVVHQGQQTSRHEHVTCRHGVRIGHRLVEDIEAIAAGKPGLGDQFLTDLVDHGLQPG